MEKDYFSQRVSVRNYSDREVSQNQIRDIIERAMRAPTCGNMQLYSVIVTRDPEMKKQLAPLHFNQPAATGASVILTVCADFNRFTRWCRLSGAKPGYDNFHSFIMAMTDAVIFAQQIVTIAETEGLGTCYLGTVNYTAKEISELLELPDQVVPVASISIGYPEGDAQRCKRLPIDAVMHMEKYRSDSDSEIMELFKVQDDDETNRKFVEENQKSSLAELFTDIRYPESVNLKVSDSFLDLIEKKGFIKK